MRIKVTDEIVTIEDSNLISSGEYNVHNCEFKFDECYDDLIKVATFTKGSHSYKVIIENNMCIIPEEVLEEYGIIFIGVYGYETSGNTLIKRYSPARATLKVSIGSYIVDASESEEPQATIAEQALGISEEAMQLSTQAMSLVDNKVDKVEGKGLSTNDYTDNDKNKLNSIESGAEINVIEGIKVNGSDLTPDLNKKVDISVPTKVSDLNNDLNFIDNTTNNLINYTTTTDLNAQLNNKANKSTTLLGYGIEDAYTKEEVDTKISSVYKYKGSVNSYADLPSTNLTIGDVYNIATADITHHIKAGDNVAWTGTEWDTLGGEIDLTDYYTKSQTNNLLNNKVDKVTGKQLSTEDFTTNEKQKLAGLSNYDDTTLTARVEALQEENEYLNNLVEQAFDKKEVEGEELSIDDTINAKMEVGLEGNTTQETAPSPDYPQEIHTVTGDNTIVVSNKNLFIGNDIHSGFVVATIGNPVTYLTSSLTETYQKCCYVKAGQQYTLSRNVNTPASTNLRTSVVCDDNDIILERLDFNSTSNSIIFTPTKTGWLYLTSDINATNIQIEDGTATSYEEHQEQTFQINLGNIEVCGIEDYKDYFYKSNNKWYLHKEIGKIVLDGSETWQKSSNTSVDRFYLDNASFNMINRSSGYSNYFINSNIVVSDIGKYYTNANQIVINFSTYDTTTLEQFKTWLSTHNTIIYYVLATPTNTEITDTTLIGQLEKLKTAMSYAQQTNISQINDDIPFILQVTALASYNSRILALENAILNANRNVSVENSLRKVSSNEIIEEPKEEVVDDNKEEPKEEIKEER